MRRPDRFPILLSVSLAITAALAASPAPAADPWPGFRGPQGTGSARTGLPPGDEPLGLEIRWNRELGSGYSGIAVTDRALFTAAAAGEADVVLALDPATGEELWRQELGPAYEGHDGSHDGPIATPAVAGDRVFTLSARGRLVALDRATGAVLWTVELTDGLVAEPPFYGFGSSPAVAGDVVVLQVGGEAGSVAEIAGRQQVLAIGPKRVAGIEPASGEVLWSFEHGGSPSGFSSYTSSPLVVSGDRLLVKHDADRSAVLRVERGGDGSPAIALHADTRGLAKSYSPPTVWDGVAYGYTARFLSAVDTDSGELLWRSRQPGDGFLVAVDGQLVVLTKEGTLHVGPARREGWQETASVELFDELAWTPPSLAGASIYARGLGGIARVDLARGATVTAEAAEEPELPAVLRPLAEAVAAARAGEGAAETDGDGGGGDPAAAVRGAVDRFLAEHRPPLADGRQAVFLWRGEPGPPGTVAIAGDMIGMRREEPMHRLEGTDLWWWATALDPRARVSYVFFVGDEPRVDPANARLVRSTVLGPDMNWQRDEPLDMSWFAMPDWPGRPRLESFEVPVEVPGGEEGVTRTEPVRLTVWLPPGYANSDARYPVVYVHHPQARTVGEWPETLERVVGDTVAPLIAVFVDRPRVREWGPLFAGEVVPAVDARYRTRTDRDGRANVGAGWSAVDTVAATLSNPELFGALGVQSLFGLEQQMQAFGEAVAAADPAGSPVRVYYEWGRWDLVSPHEAMDMRASGRRGWELLRERGFDPVGGEVWDSTDWASWRNRTGLLLEALFPADGETEAPEGLARWLTSRR